MAKKYLRKIGEKNICGSFSALGLGFAAALALAGCDNSANNANAAKEQIAKNGATVTIEKQGDGSYKVLDEFPSDTTRVILRENGSERILSQAEIDELLKQENAKIDAGTSQLTSPTGGGLSLGEAILASAAGAILGSFIGNKLFNNQNFAAQQRAGYKSPQAYERSQNSFQNKSANTSGRSGFYKPSNSTAPAATGAGAKAGANSFGG